MIEMPLARCSRGHYYDSDQYGVCPYCGVELWAPPSADSAPKGEDEKTVAKLDVTEDHCATEAFRSDDKGKTIAHRFGRTQWNPVTGWLVCTDGPERGRDYRLQAGRNFLGRALEMSVCIPEDPDISRTDHASVVYDPVSSGFFLTPGQNGTVFFKGSLLDSPTPLLEGESFQIGNTTLVLVAYCKGGVTW